MPKLPAQKCVPCEGGVPPLNVQEIIILHREIPQWNVLNEGKIEREFKFKDFQSALNFVNKVGALAEKENHHPDLLLHSWNKVRITLWTHAINGLSKNDFIVAAKVDQTKK